MITTKSSNYSRALLHNTRKYRFLASRIPSPFSSVQVLCGVPLGKVREGAKAKRSIRRVPPTFYACNHLSADSLRTKKPIWASLEERVPSLVRSFESRAWWTLFWACAFLTYQIKSNFLIPERSDSFQSTRPVIKHHILDIPLCCLFICS